MGLSGKRKRTDTGRNIGRKILIPPFGGSSPPAPASQSGLHELTYGYRSNVAAVGESGCYGNGVNCPHTATHTHTASRDYRRPHYRRVPRRSPELARRRRNLGDISSPPVCWA